MASPQSLKYKEMKKDAENCFLSYFKGEPKLRVNPVPKKYVVEQYIPSRSSSALEGEYVWEEVRIYRSVYNPSSPYKNKYLHFNSREDAEMMCRAILEHEKEKREKEDKEKKEREEWLKAAGPPKEIKLDDD